MMHFIYDISICYLFLWVTCIFSPALFKVLKQTMDEHKVKGFQQVTVSPNIKEGIASLIQASGLGGLRHNTVMMGWPYGWRQDPDAANYKVFMGKLRERKSFLWVGNVGSLGCFHRLAKRI